MTTEELFDILHSNSRKVGPASIRQAFALLLYENGLPGDAIGSILNISRKGVYPIVYNFRELVKFNDSIATKSYNEVKNNHTTDITIEVVKTTGRNKHICSSLIIDGINFFE